MEKLPGYEVIEETPTRLVQRRYVPGRGTVTLIGNPNPDPEIRQKNIDQLDEFITGCARRHQAERMQTAAGG